MHVASRSVFLHKSNERTSTSIREVLRDTALSIQQMFAYTDHIHTYIYGTMKVTQTQAINVFNTHIDSSLHKIKVLNLFPVLGFYAIRQNLDEPYKPATLVFYFRKDKKVISLLKIDLSACTSVDFHHTRRFYLAI